MLEVRVWNEAKANHNFETFQLFETCIPFTKEVETVVSPPQNIQINLLSL